MLKERDLSVVQFYRLYYEMESLSSASQDALFKSVLSSYRCAPTLLLFSKPFASVS